MDELRQEERPRYTAADPAMRSKMESLYVLTKGKNLPESYEFGMTSGELKWPKRKMIYTVLPQDKKRKHWKKYIVSGWCERNDLFSVPGLYVCYDRLNNEFTLTHG